MPDDCVHHWFIEAPSSLESTGVCQRCGDTREFMNVIPVEKLGSAWRMRKKNGPVKELADTGL